MNNDKYIQIKKERRQKKKTLKRSATAEEVIYIFLNNHNFKLN